MDSCQDREENSVYISSDNLIRNVTFRRRTEVQKSVKRFKKSENEVSTPPPIILGGDDEQKRIDRDWYNTEESAIFDADNDPFADYTVTFEQNKENNKTNSAFAVNLNNGRANNRQPTRSAQYATDNEKWESNRLLTSGVAQRSVSSFELQNDENLERIHVIVQHALPPFLKAQEEEEDLKNENDISDILEDLDCDNKGVQIYRDPTSDMARFSRKGSELVRSIRSEKEKRTATIQRTQVAGTILGNVMGVSEAEAIPDEEIRALEEVSNLNNAASITLMKEGALKQKTAKEITKNDINKQKLLKQRNSLPVFSVREDLIHMIRENQALIVVGETGSGKTTQLTQYLYEAGYSSRGIIACTQPRRVAAMSVAKRVSEEMDVSLGSLVGYTIRFEDVTSSETRIKYMTDGILLREILMDSDLDAYSCIIMDEAHERSLNTDVLMGILKRVLARRRDLKLIVTSATMNADKFSRFFGNAAIFKIPGRTFPVDVLYSKGPCEDYVESAVRQALTIHLAHPPGDILIFMTGQEDVEATSTVLRDRLDRMPSPPKLIILPMYSQLPADLQSKIFDLSTDMKNSTRRCIIATNIAETSLTIDGIVYVIDTGFCKLKFYNARIGMDALQVAPISQAQANQRSGRAGRCAAGIAYRMYTDSSYREAMHENTIPEIQRTNLANVVLLLKSVGIRDLPSFDFMDPPPRDVVLSAMYQLWILGSLCGEGDLTEMGKKMVSYPLDPSLSKMLIMSESLGCSVEMVTIVSMLSVPSVFYRPKERMEEADTARERFYVAESDHLTLLHVYIQWKAISANGSRAEHLWCTKNFIQSKAMRRADEVRKQLVDIMCTGKRGDSRRRELISSGSDWDVIRKCICSAYFHHAARLKSISATNCGSEYANMRTGLACHIHPTSALYGLGYTPDYVVYHELVLTSKEFAQCVTAVDPFWLAELGPMFFSIRGYSIEMTMQEDSKEIIKNNNYRKVSRDKVVRGIIINAGRKPIRRR